MAHRRPTLRAGRVARRLVCDLPGGDVGSDRGQFRVRPRRECLAYPRIKLIFGNPTLHKRGLEHVDYVLAVSMGRPEAAAARRGYRHLAFRLCCHRRLPHQNGAAEPSPAALWWTGRRRDDRMLGNVTAQISQLRAAVGADDRLWVVRVYRRTGISVDRLAMHPLAEVAGRE